MCYENARGRANHKGHYGYRKPLGRPVLRFWEVAEMKRPKSENANGAAGPPVEDGVLAEHPTLWAYLTEDTWEDGGRRERATVLIVTEGPTVKVWLNDRATAGSAWVAGRTLEEALLSLERQLTEGTVAWRRTEQPPKRK